MLPPRFLELNDTLITLATLFDPAVRAPAGAGTIPLGPSGLVETERHDVPHVPGAFTLTGVFSRRETAALRAAAHAVGWRKDAPDAAAPDNGRLDYCEVVMWPETAERIWWGSTDHARHVQCVLFHPVMCRVRYVVDDVAITGTLCDARLPWCRGALR